MSPYEKTLRDEIDRLSAESRDLAQKLLELKRAEEASKRVVRDLWALVDATNAAMIAMRDAMKGDG